MASKRHLHRNIAVIKPAPFLAKKAITLTDVFTVVGDTTNGKSLLMLNGNGFGDSTTSITNRFPQEGIWNQYAAMFEYY